MSETVTIERREHLIVDRLPPIDARRWVLDLVLDALAAGDVEAFVVKDPSATGSVVGVRGEHRKAALNALRAALPGPGRYLRERYDARLEQPARALTAARLDDLPERCLEFEVAQLWSVAGGALSYGFEYACRVEFWTPSPEGPDLLAAPQRYPAVGPAHLDYFSPAEIDVEGRRRPSITLFDRTFLDEVDFPIDVIYTWVDGADPAWRERMQRARAAEQGLDYHPEADAANRFHDHDELRYSLRSLEMYAPWVRHIYLVTDQQVPSWLRTGTDRLTVLDHRDIYTDQSVLPVFNSSAIISQLHHIEGLSEHYLYLNDDMFFGTDAHPGDFFLGNGLAKVFRSDVTRSFGPAAATDAPHFNISKNIRDVLEREVGRSMSQAIWHTGYPQLRSVNAEIEQRFGDVVAATAGHRFRHHDDIALDQLFHYYAQATGRAVPAHIAYQYINIGEAPAIVKLRRLLAARDLTVFCLNDASAPGTAPIPDDEVAAFLEAYFPLASGFERDA